MDESRLLQVDDDIFQMYELLNELFSLNYTCLRMSNQARPLGTSSNIITADELFRNNDKISVWVDSKLADSAELRTEVFNDVMTAWEVEKGSLISEEELAKQIISKKRVLMSFYNAYYGTKHTFNEVFDGFSALNPHFAKLAQDFDTQAVFVAEDQAMNRLMHAYYEYIDLMKSATAFYTFNQISEILKNDVNGLGKPTMFFQRHGNPDVTTISCEEIESFVRDSESVLKSVEKEIKVENKKLIPLYRKHKKDPFNYEINDEISQIKSVLHNLLTKQKQAEHYNFFANALLQRLIYANTDYDPSRWSDFCEGLFDLLAGINIFNKQNHFEFNEVYAHTLEKKYLTYLKNMFKKSPALSKENDKEENQMI